MNYLVAVDECFADRPSGSARVAWDIALMMRDRGHRVTMLCNSQPPGGAAPGPADCQGVRLIRYRRAELPAWHPGRAEAQIRAAQTAARTYVGGESFDLIHAHTPFPGAGARRAFPATELVYTVHSPVVLEQKINWSSQGLIGRLKLWSGGLRRLKRIEFDLLESARTIHVLSQYNAQQVQAMHGLGHKVTVVPHWCRPEWNRAVSKEQARASLGWPATGTIIFTVRRHVERMGLDTAVEALAPVAAGGRCMFVVAGDGPLRPALEARARALGASAQQVVFPGRLSDRDLLLAYQAADLFILPTRALEGFGLITQEAMAVGCPVVGSDAGAIPEMLRPLAPDLVFPAGDVRELRRIVEQILAGAIRVPDAGAIVDYVRDRYGPAVVIPQLAAMLERK